MTGIEPSVDAIIASLRNVDAVDENTEKLKGLGKKAVPRLLEYLASGDHQDRSLALYALQFCWGAEALTIVARILADESLEFRRMAAIVIDRHEGRERVARLCETLVDDPNPEVARFAFEHSEFMFPDVERARRALRSRALQPRISKYLARYYSSELSPATRMLLDDDDIEIARAAISGLINQNDVTQTTQARMRTALSHDSGLCRDAAAEYFAWHGTAADSLILEAAAAQEPDAYARASMRDAICAIERRGEPGGGGGRLAEDRITLHPAGAEYQRAIECLKTRGRAGRDQAFEIYCSTELLDPRWFFQGKGPKPEHQAVAHARFELQGRLFAFPWRASRDRSHSARAYKGPVASEFVAPVRDYPDPDRGGFGVRTAGTNRAFRSIVHVGDDVGWHRDHLSVLAFTHGVVRLVVREASWGHLVILEHIAALDSLPLKKSEVVRFAKTLEEPIMDSTGNVTFCSLYAHLGPFIRVRPGNRVLCGQKIATIGRSLTLENGGYPAHLHFGLHLGPYRQRQRPGANTDIDYRGKRYKGTVTAADPKQTQATIRYRGDAEFAVVRPSQWECGYIARWYWNSKKHGWLDPAAFLSATFGA